MKLSKQYAYLVYMVIQKFSSLLPGTILTIGLLLGCNQVFAQAQSAGKPWFGIALPPTFEAHSAPAIIGERGPAPAVVPSSEERFTELNGERISLDLRSIVNFSIVSRRQQELGGSQLWGRVSGFGS